MPPDIKRSDSARSSTRYNVDFLRRPLTLDHVAGDGEHALPGELLAQGLQHGDEDARLDLAPLEDADLVEGVGRSGSRGHRHASFQVGAL